MLHHLVQVWIFFPSLPLKKFSQIISFLWREGFGLTRERGRTPWRGCPWNLAFPTIQTINTWRREVGEMTAAPLCKESPLKRPGGFEIGMVCPGAQEIHPGNRHIEDGKVIPGTPLTRLTPPRTLGVTKKGSVTCAALRNCNHQSFRNYFPL